MNLRFLNLSKSYKGKTVFENISGQINEGDRIGLIGSNGVGKTTLARLLAGLEACDQGRVEYSPANIKVLYIEQYPVFDKGITVYQEVRRAVSDGAQGSADNGAVVEKTLNRVGLEKDKWQQKAQDLSGGEKTKLLLCRIMTCDFDLLILDEPTNHLDMDSCGWLEDFVRGIKKPMLVISHDRYLLDNTVNRIWELTSGEIREYEGNYSAYRVQRETELKNITKEYDKQQNKIRHLRQVIYERKSWYDSAHKSAGQNDFYRSKAKKHAGVLKSKKKELERIEDEKIGKPQRTVSPAFEVINKGITGSKLPPFLVKGESISKAFGKKTVFREVSFNIGRRDKVALIGQNGAGKTTLLRMLCGMDSKYGGTVAVSPSVKVGYFAQEFDNLSSDNSILDELMTAGAGMQDARLLLAGLSFRGDDVYKKISDLSMGEKGRVAFAKLILSGANLLILDEPTNYMDIGSKESIEAALDEFGGSIIFVTHDRYFIKRLANRVFVIKGKTLHCYDGGYEYYLSKLKEQRLRDRFGADCKRLEDNIRRLECQLAFISGKLDEVEDGDEKQKLHQKFLDTAREINKSREYLKGQDGSGSET